MDIFVGSRIQFLDRIMNTFQCGVVELIDGSILFVSGFDGRFVVHIDDVVEVEYIPPNEEMLQQRIKTKLIHLIESGRTLEEIRSNFLEYLDELIYKEGENSESIEK
jgi:hypothetical protein